MKQNLLHAAPRHDTPVRHTRAPRPYTALRPYATPHTYAALRPYATPVRHATHAAPRPYGTLRPYTTPRTPRRTTPVRHAAPVHHATYATPHRTRMPCRTHLPCHARTPRPYATPRHTTPRPYATPCPYRVDFYRDPPGVCLGCLWRGVSRRQHDIIRAGPIETRAGANRMYLCNMEEKVILGVSELGALRAVLPLYRPLGRKPLW